MTTAVDAAIERFICTFGPVKEMIGRLSKEGTIDADGVGSTLFLLSMCVDLPAGRRLKRSDPKTGAPSDIRITIGTAALIMMAVAKSEMKAVGFLPNPNTQADDALDAAVSAWGAWARRAGPEWIQHLVGFAAQRGIRGHTGWKQAVAKAIEKARAGRTAEKAATRPSDHAQDLEDALTAVADSRDARLVYTDGDGKLRLDWRAVRDLLRRTTYLKPVGPVPRGAGRGNRKRRQVFDKAQTPFAREPRGHSARRRLGRGRRPGRRSGRR